MLWPGGRRSCCFGHFLSTKQGVLGHSSCCSSCKVKRKAFGCKVSVTYLCEQIILFFLLFIVWYKNKHVVLAANCVVALGYWARDNQEEKQAIHVSGKWTILGSKVLLVFHMLPTGQRLPL